MEESHRPGAALDPHGRTRMAARPREWHPPADVCETADHFTVTLNMPGLRREQIALAMPDDKTVHIRGAAVEEAPEEGGTYLLSERPRVLAERVITLPAAVDPDRTTASLELGVLTVRLPKREPGSRGPRSIAIR